jgi:hypothetical protein
MKMKVLQITGTGFPNGRERRANPNVVNGLAYGIGIDLFTDKG